MSESEPRPELLVTKHAVSIEMPQQLIDDCAGMNDLIGRALRGEIEFKPPPKVRHHCIACWLVSLLPGHDRCSHGYLNRDCPCEEP